MPPPDAGDSDSYVSAEDEDFAPNAADFEEDPDDFAALVEEDGLAGDALRSRVLGGGVTAVAAPASAPRRVEDVFLEMKEADGKFMARKRAARAVQGKADARDSAWLRSVCGKAGSGGGPRLIGPVRTVLQASKRSSDVVEEAHGAGLRLDTQPAMAKKPRPSPPGADSLAIATKAKATIAQTKAVFTEVVRYAGQSIKYVRVCGCLCRERY